MTTTSSLPPLVAYYGTLIDLTTRDHEYVTSGHEAEQVIPSLVRGVPVVAVRSGEYSGDYMAMVAIPYVLPDSFGDDEYLFEVDIFEPAGLGATR